MDKSQEMFRIIEAYESSGQDRKSFCKQAGISLSKFGYWRTKWLGAQKKSTLKSPNFVAFETAQAPPTIACELIYPSGIRVQFQSIEIPALKALLHV